MAPNLVLHFPVYEIRLNVYVPTTEKDLLATLNLSYEKNGLKDKDPLDSFQALSFSLYSDDDGHRVAHMIIKKEHFNINTVVHESLHAAVTINNAVDIYFNEYTEEAFTYLTGYIAEQIYNNLINNDEQRGE